jgi:PAS domain S-box-containing protein
VADGLVDAYRGAFSSTPAPALLLSTDLVILDMNEAYLRAVGLTREQLVGRYVFQAFPSTDDDDVSPLEASMRRALSSGRPVRMPLVKYDLPATPGSDLASERWWSVVNVPVRDTDGVVQWLLNAVEDVTEVVQERARAEAHRSSAALAHDRTQVLERDLWTRSEQLARLVVSEAEASRRLTGLAEVALELASAETTTALVDVIVGRGLVALGPSA